MNNTFSNGANNGTNVGGGEDGVSHLMLLMPLAIVLLCILCLLRNRDVGFCVDNIRNWDVRDGMRRCIRRLRARVSPPPIGAPESSVEGEVEEGVEIGLVISAPTGTPASSPSPEPAVACWDSPSSLKSRRESFTR